LLDYKQHHPYSLTPAASGATATDAYFPGSSGPGGAVGSLDAMMEGGNANANADAKTKTNNGNANGALEAGNQEDELFALPMSPRSPEMTKSPFSLLK
jgi:hypothetical protein